MSERVLVHVRFTPNGLVTEIGERPEGVSAQAWFDRLSNGAFHSYQPLSGGRGVFRLHPDELSSHKTASLN
jgi:hypothetical protein